MSSFEGAGLKSKFCRPIAQFWRHQAQSGLIWHRSAIDLLLLLICCGRRAVSMGTGGVMFFVSEDGWIGLNDDQP
ncbi:MAG: hypothetical protein EA001_03510 [Oscillatoriales cyanobacterium]|nr:MAG: hypothetical protein EA001_03510 [Oscillatoriales cyanobacterium]